MQNNSESDELEGETQSQSNTWAAGPVRRLPAVVRAHLVESQQESIQAEVMRREGQGEKVDIWPSLCLVFDTETGTDEFGNLRFGTYIVEFFHPLIREVVRLDAGFFTGESLNESERELIESYCKSHNLTYMTRREWLNKIFFVYGYKACGAVIGFNLPFDLARIATRSSVITSPRPQKPRKDGSVFFRCRTCHQRRKFQLEREEDGSLSCYCTVCNQKPKFQLVRQEDGKVAVIANAKNFFAGGWKFNLYEYEKKKDPGQWRERAWRPSVCIKPINSRAAMFRSGFFDGWKEKGDFYPGHFLDLRTLGCALSGEKNGSLRSFGELFGARVLKNESHDEHGGQLTEAYLEYAMNDAGVTLALYHAEMQEFKKHQLDVTPDHIYSGASLGKAYLNAMGIHAPPFMIVADGLPFSQDEIFGFGMSAYYSGRAEAQIVKIVLPVTYVDFHSMYPAVFILQGLWDLLKAEKVKVIEVTQETKDFLASFKPESLFQQETWKRLPILCLILPQDDLLPVRADYRWRKSQDSKFQHRTAMVPVSSALPMWYTLSDCLLSQIKTGRSPHILLALKFSSEGSRPLKPISIRGAREIDPNQEDFFRALVEARDRLGKDDPKLAEALKVIANSASYGIWPEIDIEDGERPVTAYSTEQRRAIIPHGEKPGRYYFPPLAAFITAGGRLMLGLLESEIQKHGGVSAFCDTDSLAIVSSQNGGTITYREDRKRRCEIPSITWGQVDEVLDQFNKNLNPCRSGATLIKLERENFEDKDPTKPRVNLHAYVIAAKRYALFVPPDHIVKPSYHTLGMVEPPRDATGHAIEDWIDEFWKHIVTRRRFDPPWANQWVELKIDISQPEIWKSFNKVRAKAQIETGNKRLDKYLSGIKPFNFMGMLAQSAVTLREEKLPVVIAPLRGNGQTPPRLWVAKSSDLPVHVLQAVDEIERQEEYYQAKKINQHVITPKTFAELMDYFRDQRESTAVDQTGQEIRHNTQGRLTHPRVAISELLFTGKESVLQEEIENGIVTEEEAEVYRFVIRPERDPASELIIEAMRLLSKAEMRRLDISRREVDRIKGGDSLFALKNDSTQSRLMGKLVKYLQKHYPTEIGTAQGEAELRAFMDNRTRLLEQWQMVKPRLVDVSTKELMNIVGCSRGTAKNIKYKRTQPSIETIKKIMVAYPNGYNSDGI
jgi:hypothetical protein